MTRIASVFVVGAAAFLSAWSIDAWVFEPAKCNVAITELTQRTDAVHQLRSPYDQVRRARRNLEELRALGCHTDVRVAVLIAANEEALGQYDDAIDAYRSALLVDRRPEIYFMIGDALVQLGRTDEAVESYVIAARFTPFILDNLTSPEINRRVRERLRPEEAQRTP